MQAFDGFVQGIQMNKLRLVVIFASLMVLSVYFAGAASAEGVSVYDWLTKLNRAVFGITGAQVAESTTAVASSDGAGDGATSDGGGGSGGGGASIINECQKLYGNVTAAYGSSCGNARYDHLGDLNGDKIINALDLSLLAGKLGDAAWCSNTLAAATNPCVQIAVAACADSYDGGFNLYKKGTAIASVDSYSQSYTDYCSGGSVYEYYCRGSNNEIIGNGESGTQIEGEYETCPYGCSDGACMEKEVSACQALLDTVKASYGKGCGDAGYDSVADVNRDQKVNSLDLSLVGVNFNNPLWCQAVFASPQPACVEEVPVCADSYDGGFNLYKKGTAIASVYSYSQSYTDYCSGGSVYEYYCRGSNNEIIGNGESGTQVEGEYETCPYGCSDGACVTGEVPIGTGAEASLPIGDRSYKVVSASDTSQSDFPVLVDYNADGAMNAHLPITGSESGTISKNTYFYLWGYGVMQYMGADSFSSPSHLIRFRDVKTGSPLEVTYQPEANVSFATLPLGGKSYGVSASVISSNDFDIKVDMDGSGVIGDRSVNIVNNELVPVQKNDYVYLVGYGDLVRYTGADSSSSPSHAMRFQDVRTGNMMEVAYTVTGGAQCTDYDDGNDIYTPSYVERISGDFVEIHYDTCDSANSLTEYECFGDDVVVSNNFCSNGCKMDENSMSGACVRSEPTSLSLSEGETKSYTLGGRDYEVTADYVGSTSAKFTVNGQITPYLVEGGSFVLADGVKIGIVDIGVQDYAGGVRKVSFTLTASVDGNLYEGEAKTYTLNSHYYDVSADFIGSTTARLSVNGELTPPLVAPLIVTSVNGEAWRVGTPAKKLELSESLSARSLSAKQETIRNITTFVTDDELPALLADGTFRNSKGDYNYHQYMYFDNVNAQTTTAAASLSAIYAEDPDTDVTADYFYVKNSDRIARYSLEFTSSAESDITDSSGSASTTGTYLWSLEGKDITLLGKTYSIVKARRTSSTGNSAELTLIGGAVKDRLAEGESRTYAVSGKEYEVKLDFVGSTTAKFTVNGELTGSIQEGDTYTLSDKSLIGVTGIIPSDFGGGVRSVEFYLGATRIFLKDTDIANTGTGSQSLEVGSTKIDDTKVTITGSDDNTTFKIDTIQLNITADDDFYVPAGGKLSAQMEKPEALLSSWDIDYAGLDSVATEKIQIKTSASNQYYLEFVDGSGNKVSVPLAYTSGGTSLTLGDSTNALVITENTTIAKNDYFIVTDGSQNQGRRRTYAVRYMGASASGDSSPLMEFQVLGESGTKEEDYSAQTGDAVIGSADAVLNLGGAAYRIWNVTPDTSSDFSIVIDLNGNGVGDTVATAQNLQTVNTANLVNVTTRSGAQILIRPFPLSSSYLKLASAVPMTAVNISIQTPNADDYDSIAPTPVDFDITAASGIVKFAENNAWHGDHNYLSPQGESNTNYAYTSLGAKVKWDNPSNYPDTLEIDYPTVQRLPLVYITAPGAEISTGEADGSSFVLADGATIRIVNIEVQDYAGGVRWVQFTLSLSAKEKSTQPPFPPDESFAGTVWLSPGWNLIGTFLLDGASVSVETDCDDSNNILAAYYYDPVARRYVGLGPSAAEEPVVEENATVETPIVEENETTTSSSAGTATTQGSSGAGGGGSTPSSYGNYLMLDKVNSFWIKVASSCKVNFELDRPYGWLSEVQDGNKKLASGWNFLSVVPDMVDYGIDDFSGTCSVSRAYGFDPESQSWASVRDETFPKYAVGAGYAVKVAGDCVLGPARTVSEVPRPSGPPELPAE